jgi:Zn-dependent alcohol dehydrogenase
VAIAPEAPLDAAALLACGVLTGVGAVVNTARVPVGSSVVVIGTGGVGLNSVQGAALSGATPIVAVDVAAEKLAAAAFFGASHTVDASSEDVRELVLGLTGGRGADYVFAAVGAKAPIEQGLSLLRRAGTLVIVGMPATGVMTEFEAGELANDSQRILGSKVGSARPEIDLPRLLELYRQGRLKLDELISARYRLDEINDAIASAHRGSALRNVIVF